jgi:hypothetical protein
MKFITKIITYIIREKPPPLPQGRWKINYCSIKTDRKIDLANEDHCGTCNQYAHEQLNLEKEKQKHKYGITKRK